MTGMEARQVISTIRRQLRWMTLTRVVLLAVMTFVVFVDMAQPEAVGDKLGLFWLLGAAAASIWVAFTVFSVRQARASQQASAFVASGRLDLAEEQLKGILSRFSFFRQGKLLACHNLAVIAHGRKDYDAAAELCGGIVSLRTGPPRSIGRTCRILLADCRLLLGDAAAAADAIKPLSVRGGGLNLVEQLLLLPVELRCQIASKNYRKAVDGLAWKVRRAELLDSPKAALTHALLARACRETGEIEKADYLQRRAELYHDLSELDEVGGALPEWAAGDTSADNTEGCGA